MMKFRAVVPVLALAAFGAACEDKEDPTTVNTSTANVRFVNTIQGTNNLLLTSNGSAVGSAQNFGSFSSTCVAVPSGTNRSLAFGTAASGGTTLTNTLGTSTANLAAGGNFTVVATGTQASPRLLVLDNQPTTAATTGNANIRFVNATGQAIDFFTSSGTTVGTATFANVAANSAASNGSFTTVPITNGVLTFRAAGGTSNLFSTSITGTNAFQSGQNYTVVLFPNVTGTGFQAVTFQGC